MGIDPGNNSWLPASWDAPSTIRAGTSTRLGGHSLPPFDTLNLALHVGDVSETVRLNRSRLSELLKLPSTPVWLEQVHGNRIVTESDLDNNIADGIYSEKAGVVCVIMTADCVPLLLCNTSGTKIAAVHAGWRGFCAGVIDKALALFGKDEVQAWIGPHIGADHYEVGDDVRSACLHKYPQLAHAFQPNQRGRWQANLETMVRHSLAGTGVKSIFSSNYCTYSEADKFYSYRRNPQTGRTASMIWMDR
jgi:YfiH family protein